MKPLNNRVIAKIQMPNRYVSSALGLNIPVEELEIRIKSEMMHSLAREIMDKIPVEKMEMEGFGDTIEYTVEAYVFTKEELKEFVRSCK